MKKIEPKSIKKFTINRNTWLRGKRTLKEGSYLRWKRAGKHVMRCCLGFYLEACGVSPKGLNSQGSPRNIVSEVIKAKADWLLSEAPGYLTDSLAASDLMEINDSLALSPKEIEDQVKQLFKKQGITVHFVGRK